MALLWTVVVKGRDSVVDIRFKREREKFDNDSGGDVTLMTVMLRWNDGGNKDDSVGDGGVVVTVVEK